MTPPLGGKQHHSESRSLRPRQDFYDAIGGGGNQRHVAGQNGNLAIHGGQNYFVDIAVKFGTERVTSVNCITERP